MKARYFIKVLGITIFSLLLLNNLAMAQIHYDSSGNVGIGTTNPEQTLEVVGSIGVRNNFNTNLVLKRAGTTPHTWILGVINGSNLIVRDQDNFKDVAIFETGAPSGSLIVKSSGNVGIGTTDPSGPLDVKASFPSISLTDSDHPSSVIGFTSTVDLRDNSDSLAGFMGYDSSGDNDFTLANTLATNMDFFVNGETRLRIDSSGNVGIGTTSPTEKLDVAGTVKANSFVGDGSQLTGISGSGQWSEDIHGLYYNGEVRIGSRVNINSLAPTIFALHVNGTAYATGAAGALSDLRRKKNISDLSFDALTIVNELHPVTFEWKEPQDSGMEGTELGFIAQEVEGLLPEAVLTQDNEEQTKGLKYNALIPLLTKAIQELKAQNEALKAENNSLRYEIGQIKEAIGL